MEDSDDEGGAEDSEAHAEEDADVQAQLRSANEVNREAICMNRNELLACLTLVQLLGRAFLQVKKEGGWGGGVGWFSY